VTDRRPHIDPADDAATDRVVADRVAADLVEYLIVAVPDLASLEPLAPAIAQLVHRGAIRILDAVVVLQGLDGVVDALELDAVESMAAVRDLFDGSGGMLSGHDVELAALALRPGSAGLVLVTEDRWAQPLSDAARRAGGQVLTGERIPALRVESALSDTSAAHEPAVGSPRHDSTER
jgi:hypothetical protein